MKDGKVIFVSYPIDIDMLVDTECLECQHWSTNFLFNTRRLMKEKKNQLLYIDVGDTHFRVIGNKGQIYQWGCSDLNQLGYFSPTASTGETIPRTIDQHISDISWIQSGFNHTVVYSKSSNKLLLFGDNQHGQLATGNFSSTHQYIDLSHIIKQGTSIKQIDARANHTCIVLTDGTSYIHPCIDSRGSISHVPVYASFNEYKIVSVSLGYDYSVYLLDNGMIYTMGCTNSKGELGHGDTIPRYVPTKVKSLAREGHM